MQAQSLANKPATAMQVAAPTVTVATAPGPYTGVSSGSPVLTNYETSPLNRATMALVPGNDALRYLSNDVSTNISTTSTTYDAGELYKNVTIDEQNHAVVEFKDKEGQVVLKGVQIGTAPTDFPDNSGWLSTYYVHDDLNQLRFVIPPKEVAAMLTAGNWTLTSDITSMAKENRRTDSISIRAKQKNRSSG
jgi:hypothetical protein